MNFFKTACAHIPNPLHCSSWSLSYSANIATPWAVAHPADYFLMFKQTCLQEYWLLGKRKNQHQMLP